MPVSGGNLVVLADYQRCRELDLFCQSCLLAWQEAVPRSFGLSRFPCPCCGLRGAIRACTEWESRDIP